MSQPDQLREALKTLGLDQDADRTHVVRTYRRLAKANHPDVSRAPDATERFRAINAAYRYALRPPTWTARPGGSDARTKKPKAVAVPAIRVVRTQEPWIVVGPVHIERRGLPTTTNVSRNIPTGGRA